MRTKEILQRLEKIEADVGMGVSSPDSTAWLCQIVRELLTRLDSALQCSRDAQEYIEKLEAQCAAMREVLEAVLKEIGEALDEQLCDAAGERARLPIERQIMKALQSDAGRDLLERLRKLLAVAEAARALTEDIRQGEGCADWDVVIRLEQALAALEEGK